MANDGKGVYSVLVAEYDPATRKLARDWLTMLGRMGGYESIVYEATDDPTALEELAKHPKMVAGRGGGGIDFAIRGTNSPQETGLEFFVKGQETSPATKFMLWSFDCTDNEPMAKRLGVQTLQKPTACSKFRAVVEGYLNSK